MSVQNLRPAFLALALGLQSLLAQTRFDQAGHQGRVRDRLIKVHPAPPAVMRPGRLAYSTSPPCPLMRMSGRGRMVVWV